MPPRGEFEDLDHRVREQAELTGLETMAGDAVGAKEEVYLHDYQTVPAARAQLSDYFEFYNTDRPHEGLGYKTPHEVYFGTQAALAPAPEAMFDMDRIDIVVPRANGEADFPVFKIKMASEP